MGLASINTLPTARPTSSQSFNHIRCKTANSLQRKSIERKKLKTGLTFQKTLQEAWY